MVVDRLGVNPDVRARHPVPVLAVVHQDLRELKHSCPSKICSIL